MAVVLKKGDRQSVTAVDLPSFKNISTDKKTVIAGGVAGRIGRWWECSKGLGYTKKLRLIMAKVEMKSRVRWDSLVFPPNAFDH